MVRRALIIAVGWAYIAALVAVIVVGIAALVALIVAVIVYLLDFSTRELEMSRVVGPAGLVAWLLLPVAAGISVWTAAYGSTQRYSLKRASLAIVLALVTALLMWFTGSLALPMIALAVGWSVAIPVEHPGRWLARIALAMAVLPLFPVWDGRGIEVVLLAAAIGPGAAGLSVVLGDSAWSGVVKLRSRGDEGGIRAPNSLDA